MVKIRDNDTTPETIKDVPTTAVTIRDVKPIPPENYAVTFERALLSDSTPLSKFDEKTVLDLWRTGTLSTAGPAGLKLRRPDRSIVDVPLSAITVRDLKPEPKDRYTVSLYNGRVLPDSFVLRPGTSASPGGSPGGSVSPSPSPSTSPSGTVSPSPSPSTSPSGTVSPSPSPSPSPGGSSSPGTSASPSPLPTDQWTLPPNEVLILTYEQPIDFTKILGESVLRELDSNVYVPEVKVEDDEYTPPEMFATAARMGIDAVGPHEKLTGSTATATPILHKHTEFSIVQKELLITTGPPYLGQILTVPILPGETGDLVCNMYFTCTLPPNINYCPKLGRALFRRVELCLNEQIIQSYEDDWAVIHDDVFMTAEESLVLDKILNNTGRLYIPLKFFFNQKDQYLPLCALFNQTVYLKFYFNSQTWITDYPGTLDIINPSLVFDQVFLTMEERLFYRNKPLELVIPVVEKETPVRFTKGEVSTDMAVNFNVSAIFWFVRNVNYEDPTSTNYALRYSYGYVSPLVNSYTKFVDWRGNTVNYVQVIDKVEIFIRNINILRNLTGDLYFTYRQPIEHGLSVPDNVIYMYCFSDEPKNPIKRGDLDFSKIPAKATKLNLRFSPSLVPQLVQSYRLYMYYYGYKTLSIDRGFGVLRA